MDAGVKDMAVKDDLGVGYVSVCMVKGGVVRHPLDGGWTEQ